MSSSSPHTLWNVRRETLVPITLDIDADGIRVFDSFVWDLHQNQVSLCCSGTPVEVTRRGTLYTAQQQ